MVRGPEAVVTHSERSRLREKRGDIPAVFVSGSWQAEKAISLTSEAHQLGRHLAYAGFDLIIGPGTGIARYVIEGYRSVPKRGHVVFYLPSEAEMKRVGESVEAGADETYKTGLRYPERNLIQVDESDAMIAIGGSGGTASEIIAAALDFGKPTVVLRGSEAYRSVTKLSDVKKNVVFVSSPQKAVETIQNKLRKVA